VFEESTVKVFNRWWVWCNYTFSHLLSLNQNNILEGMKKESEIQKAQIKLILCHNHISQRFLSKCLFFSFPDFNIRMTEYSDNFYEMWFTTRASPHGSEGMAWWTAAMHLQINTWCFWWWKPQKSILMGVRMSERRETITPAEKPTWLHRRDRERKR